MMKSGLNFGVLGFVLVLVISLVSPLCSLCVTLLLGLGAGYVAANTERPLASNEGTRIGAGAGALAGGLVIPGQLIAAAINASAMQGPGGQVFNELLGLPPADPTTVWLAQLAVGCCIGLLNLGVFAGMGAVGSALWFRRGRGAASQEDEPLPPAL